MNKEITDKITGIIKDAEKQSWVNYDLQKDHSLSQAYPEGEQAYFKQRIFELKKQIAESTMIGQHWIENYCSNYILISDWINKHTQIALKYMNETEVWKQLKTFMYQYFQLLSYEDFIKGITEQSSPEPIIDVEYINIIYKNFKEYFDESLQSWTERFIRNGQPVNPIKLDPKAKEGSNRLVLIAILAAIQTATGNEFDFNEFAFIRFGIKNFQKAKSDHKHKQTYKDIYEKCNRIIKK